MASKSIPPIEIGSFVAPTPDKSEFIGSATGVFFVNTVFRAFSKSANGLKERPENVQRPIGDPGSASNSILDPDGPQEPADNANIGIKLHTSNEFRSYGITGHGLGIAPGQSQARALMMEYFQNWHPIFPFLHGPTFLRELDELYDEGYDYGVQPNMRKRLCRAVIFQCVFNVATDGKEKNLPSESKIQSATTLLSLIGHIACSHDNLSLQALMAAQIYLISIMSLRAASTIGGTLTRMLYHGGFHRCPLRYIQLPSDVCAIRKRIFWSAYAADRFLSQALGHPLVLQDSDIDVCIPGAEEYHKPVISKSKRAVPGNSLDDEVLAHLPQGHPAHSPSGIEDSRKSSSAHQNNQGVTSNQRDNHKQLGEEILANYITYCQLTGQTLELLHKSIQHRDFNRDHLLELTSSVHEWWNRLPPYLQGESDSRTSEQASNYASFFIMIYNHLIIMVNRPFLSLPTKTTEFKSSLQTAIGASRTIVSRLKQQTEQNTLILWPGVLPATWMAGLVLAFSATLEMYPIAKAKLEITECLKLLKLMETKWPSARHCQAALTSLLEELKRQFSKSSTTGSSSRTSSAQKASARSARGVTRPSTGTLPNSTKRRKQNSDHSEQTTLPATSTSSSISSIPSHQQQQQQLMPTYQYSPNDPLGFSALPNFDYLGIEMGFDTTPFDWQNGIQDLGFGIIDDTYPDMNNAFGSVNWDTMVNDSTTWNLRQEDNG